MKFILALLLAIPTYGISLIVLLLYSASSNHKASRRIDRVIIHLSSDPLSWGACIEGLPYNLVFGYAKSFGKIIYRDDFLIKFEISLNDKMYLVTLDKEPNGRDAILISKDISGRGELLEWTKGIGVNYTTTSRDLRQMFHRNKHNIPDDVTDIISLKVNCNFLRKSGVGGFHWST